jgi:cation diffusion facilitator family transporter
VSHFPDPIFIPKEVEQSRKERLRQLATSCLIGVVIRLIIILGEFAGFVIFGSSALMMDALSSLLDVVSSLFLLICIRFAARPPDENHPFGHGRFEPLIGLQLGLLLVVVGGGMLAQQSFALSTTEGDRIINSYAWIIPLCAVILLEISYQVVMRVAKRQNSPALAADAVHYRIDGITSLCAAIALIVAAYFPSWSVVIDHLGAIFIALLMIIIGGYALLQNLQQILDKTPEKSCFDRVKAAAKRVEGVRDTEKIRIQVCGPDAHVDIDVEVDPFLSVEVAHVISQKVRAEIQKEWPLVQDVIVHIEPYYPNDH